MILHNMQPLKWVIMQTVWKQTTLLRRGRIFTKLHIHEYQLCTITECGQRLERITMKCDYCAQAWGGLWVIETHFFKVRIMLFL